MRWGKFILILQALVTLAVGLLFFSQYLNLGIARIVPSKQIEVPVQDISFNDGAQKLRYFELNFNIASYILTMVALIELILIWRIVS